MKLIESFPEPESHVEAKARARDEARKISLSKSAAEKAMEAQATYLKVRKALFDGSAKTSADSTNPPPKRKLSDKEIHRLALLAACRKEVARRKAERGKPPHRLP